MFQPAQLEGLIHMHAGEPANAVQLASDLQAVHQLYGTRGYMAASVKATAQMDDARSTVSYQLLVHEGDVYKMGELEIRGLDERNTAHVEDVWQLRGGEPYDSSYPKRFVDELQKELSLMEEWNITIHEAPNEEDKTVDVTVRFDPKLSR